MREFRAALGRVFAIYISIGAGVMAFDWIETSRIFTKPVGLFVGVVAGVGVMIFGHRALAYDYARMRKPAPEQRGFEVIQSKDSAKK